MANKCAICGADINVFGTQKLADGSCLCRKVCCKKALKYFDLVHASLQSYKLHAAQVERGTKIWTELFVPHLKDKSIKRNFSPIYVAPELGLMALVETRYKFMNFGKSQHACVYRIDDLIGYDMETDTKTVDGKQQTEYFVRYSFRGTDGMTSFRVKYESASSCGAVAKYFNELFGIQKTLGNAMNNWSRQKDAIGSIVSAVSAASNGDENAEDRVGAAMDALDSAVYGDRSELKTRADAALSAYDV